MPRHRFTDTRERIEKAAIRLFVEKGVTETTVRDIARAVDISEGALYRHFDSKDELVWQLFERHYVAVRRSTPGAGTPRRPHARKLAAMIRGFCRAHDENPTLFRFLLFVQHGQLSKLAPGRRRRSTWFAPCSRGDRSEEIPAQHADLATALVFGVVLQPVQFAAYGRLPSAMTSLSDRLIAAAWAAVTAV